MSAEACLLSILAAFEAGVGIPFGPLAVKRLNR